MRNLTKNIRIFLCCMSLAAFVPQNMPAEQRVTNPSRGDGFGEQFLFVISSLFYAELHRMKYVYTPFISVEHNYDNDPHFLKKKEWLINFLGNIEVNRPPRAKVLGWPVNLFFSADTVAKFSNSDTLRKIRALFRANKNRPSFLSNDGRLSVVLHIRRHNPHDNRIDGTNTPDELFLSIIEKLRKVYAAQNPIFHIQSQGPLENFKKFIAPDIVLHLNESIEDAFISMAYADVLVTSRSTFSYTAALLCEGTVYFIPFECVKLPQWIAVDTLLSN